MKTLKISLLLLTFFLAACKKEKLTKETQIGANTFSCKINGKVYVAKNELFSKGITVLLLKGRLLDTHDLGIEIVLYNGDKSDYTIDVDLFNMISPATYIIDNVNSRAGMFDRKTNDYKANKGQIIITKFDQINRIISGRFEFNMVNEKDNSHILSITEGRFDLKY